MALGCTLTQLRLQCLRHEGPRLLTAMLGLRSLGPSGPQPRTATWGGRVAESCSCCLFTGDGSCQWGRAAPNPIQVSLAAQQRKWPQAAQGSVSLTLTMAEHSSPSPGYQSSGARTGVGLPRGGTEAAPSHGPGWQPGTRVTAPERWNVRLEAAPHQATEPRQAS